VVDEESTHIPRWRVGLPGHGIANVVQPENRLVLALKRIVIAVNAKAAVVPCLEIQAVGVAT
jgi:hypothetical protein